MKHKNHLLQLTLIFLIFAVSLTAAQDIKCHYSCANCTKGYHQYCRACREGYQLEILKNMEEIPVEFRDTRVSTGVCRKGDQTGNVGGVNGLGIALLVCAMLLLPLTRSNLLFYITSSLQSLSLIHLLQISWPTPTSYLLQSFQYLSPCNLFTSQLKSTSYEMKLYSYYHLDRLYIQPQIEKSLLLVGSLDVAVFGMVVLLYFGRILKRRYFVEVWRGVWGCSQGGLKDIGGYFGCLFYFLIQQTILSYVVALQFTTANSFLIGTLTLYSILLLLFSLYTYKSKLPFQNRLTQYYSYIKKIIYPIFTVIPFQFQYFLIIFMAINCILEAFFDYQIKSYPVRSRWTVYKVLEVVTIGGLGVCWGVDGGDGGGVGAVGVAVGVLLAGNVGCFFLEIILSIKERLQAAPRNELAQHSPSKNHLPETSSYDREQHNNTLGMVSTKRQQRRQSTQSDLVQNQRAREGVDKLNESVDEPAKAQRETKDSSFKVSKDQKEKFGDLEPIQDVEEIEEVKLEKAADGKDKVEEVKQAKMSKESSAKKMKAEELKSQLRKRYGV